MYSFVSFVSSIRGRRPVWLVQWEDKTARSANDLDVNEESS